MSSSKLTRSTELNKNKKWSSNAESWDECFVWLSLRLRIWGSGVRIPSGAPLISMGYGKRDLTEIIEMFAGVSARVTNRVDAACAMLCRGRLI